MFEMMSDLFQCICLSYTQNLSAHFVIYFMHLGYDVSNNLFLSICLLCMNFVVIITLLFVGLRVTYMYLFSFVLTMFSISVLYLLFYSVYLKANNFFVVGVSRFSISSAVALWPFLVAPSLLHSINLLLGSVLTCLRWCQICFNVSA